MKDLVTDVAINAGVRVTAADEMGGAFADSSEFAEAILTAAAPFIAAEALRQAAGRFDDMDKESFDPWYWSDLSDELRKWADELEADAAFTGMVQQGQEIGEK